MTKDELARHCRRRTRGTTVTIKIIDQLIASLLDATDSLGVPLFRPDAEDIWRVEEKHVSCLQDPTGVALYTKTKEILKGNVSLPVYRCARGTTSIESFHLHLKTMIPGKSSMQYYH